MIYLTVRKEQDNLFLMVYYNPPPPPRVYGLDQCAYETAKLHIHGM